MNEVMLNGADQESGSLDIDMLHKLELKIAVEIKRVCELHNICYFLAYGSMLGAVRHQGFIPWDDDLDIAMPREDYERFIEIFNSETDTDTYFLENWDTEEGFGLSFSKVKLNGTVFEENSISRTDTHKGIFVDIFPYDGLPNNPALIGKIAKKANILEKIYKFRLKYLPTDPNDKKQMVLSKIIGLMCKPISKRTLRNAILKEENRYNDNPVYCSVISSAYACRDIIPYKLIKKTVYVPFEGESFPVPEEYDCILTCIYGDYMQLPPVEQRVFRHNAKRIDFGIYANQLMTEGII